MKFKNIRIKCPVCGRIKIYSSEGKSASYRSKDGERLSYGDENECECSDCKEEFVAFAYLTEREREFYEKVLVKGQDAGFWIIDEFTAGGAGQKRGIMGVDFRLKREKPYLIELLLEAKKSRMIEFTSDQLRRFLTTIDINFSATRFYGLKESDISADVVTILFVWTPKFIQALPRDVAFRPIGGTETRPLTHRLSLTGLEAYIEKYTFTTLKEEYQENFWEKLLTTPNLTINTVEGGEFGTSGVKYRPFPLDHAYNIFFEKLRYTMDNLGEDVKRIYPLCEVVEPTVTSMQRIIEGTIGEMLTLLYRPLYVADVVEKLRGYQRVSDLIEYAGKVPYVKKRKLGDRVRDILRRWIYDPVQNPNGTIIQLKPSPEFKKWSYGLRGRKYIPLKYSSSLFLDNLKESIKLPKDRTGEYPNWSKEITCFTIKEIAERVGMDEELVRGRVKRSGKELEKVGLLVRRIREPRLTGSPFIYCLTENGVEYITRTGEFKT